VLRIYQRPLENARERQEKGFKYRTSCAVVWFSQRSQARVQRARRLRALRVREQRVGELREVQEHETEDWSQGLKLTNWVRPNNKDEDEGKGNSRGTGRRWRHFGDNGGTLETMEALRRQWKHSETMETLGDDLLMDRVVLGARGRWKPNLTETERESRSLLLFQSIQGSSIYMESPTATEPR